MTKITNFVWNPVDDCIISELDGTGAVQAVYTNEPQQYGGVISQRRGTTTSTHHHDALGSTRFLTDSSGNVTDTYLNDAWGNQLASTGPTLNPFKWVGKYGYYTDDSTGQVYVRARMYQPTVARWSSFDPMGFVEGPNRAQYALSNPTCHVDKSGYACTSCCCCAEGIRGPFGVNLNPSTVDPNFGVGTYFELLVDIQLRPFQESLPCLLEYWEWASPNDGERGQKNCWRNSLEGQQEETNKKTVAWCDLTRPGDPRPTDADWCEFVHSSEFPKRRCPSSFSIPLQDAPTIRKSANNSRRLYFHVVAKSTPECECWSDTVVWEGCQVIELDAVGNAVKKEFHSGTSTCPSFPEFTEQNKCVGGGKL